MELQLTKNIPGVIDMKKVTAALLLKDNRILIAKRPASDSLANK